MFCWNLWWVGHWLSGDHELFNCRLLHYPFGISLNRHTFSLANGIIASPITCTIGPVTAYNLLILFHAIVTVWATYLLARQLGSAQWQSIIAAAIFTWWPSRLVHATVHLNLASTGWMVLTLLFFIKANQISRRRYIPLAILFFVLTGASSWHLLLQLCLLLPFFLFLPVLSSRPSLKSRLLNLLILIGIGLWFSAHLIVPLIQPDLDIPLISMQEKQKFSIPPIMMVTPPIYHPFWGSSFKTVYNELPGNIVENTGFTGYIVIVLLLIGLCSDTYQKRWLIGIGALFAILSFGPVLAIGSFRLPLPYGLIERLPWMNFSRTPGRFLISTGLLWSLACSGVLMKPLFRRRGLAVILPVMIILEFLPGKPVLSILVK